MANLLSQMQYKSLIPNRNKSLLGRSVNGKRRMLNPKVEKDIVSAAKKNIQTKWSETVKSRKKNLAENTEDYDKACYLLAHVLLLQKVASTLMDEVHDVLYDYGLMHTNVKNLWNHYEKAQDAFSRHIFGNIIPSGEEANLFSSRYSVLFPQIMHLIGAYKYTMDLCDALESDYPSVLPNSLDKIKDDKITFTTAKPIHEALKMIAERNEVSLAYQINNIACRYIESFCARNPDSEVTMKLQEKAVKYNEYYNKTS